MGEEGGPEATAEYGAVSDGPPAHHAPAGASSGCVGEMSRLSGTAFPQPPALGSGGAPNCDSTKFGRYRDSRVLMLGFRVARGR
jgi:hypothetical protein